MVLHHVYYQICVPHKLINVHMVVFLSLLQYAEIDFEAFLLLLLIVRKLDFVGDIIVRKPGFALKVLRFVIS